MWGRVYYMSCKRWLGASPMSEMKVIFMSGAVGAGSPSYGSICIIMRKSSVWLRITKACEA